MSSLIYFDIGEYVKNESFLVKTPLYASLTPLAVDEGFIEQQILPDKNAFGRSRLTIEMMIDYYKKKIPFTLMVLKDIHTIKIHLDIYIELLKRYQDNPQVLELLKDTNALQVQFNRMHAVYLKSHPEIEREMINRDFDAIFSKYLSKEE